MPRILTGPVLYAMLFALSVTAEAQQPGKIFRIGFLDNGTASGSAVLLDAFRQEMRKLEWIEGKNIIIETRFAEGKGKRLPELVAELVHLNVDLVVAGGNQAVRPAKELTKTIPIVVVHLEDPVREGFVASLARPGGNITGLSRIAAIWRGNGWNCLRKQFPRSAAWLCC